MIAEKRKNLFKKMEEKVRELREKIKEGKEKEMKELSLEMINTAIEIYEIIPDDVCLDYYFIIAAKNDIENSFDLETAYGVLYYCSRITYDNFEIELGCMGISKTDLHNFDATLEKRVNV